MNEKQKIRLLPPLSRDTVLDYAIVLVCTLIAAAAIMIDYLR
jgi:hypothetical protein